ncbi:hypothetical protein [Pseudomonas sp. 460]|uniref:hypothetical protein n=1 Tax=Pseudomonas sp. 460 TaxID=2485142 RepID=UPI0010E13248|nr:hypothetical protein [Pseudomonas sp. 460]TCV51549.1 hypothetical protein EDB99_107215 [Pseudomonas sp. 460]
MKAMLFAVVATLSTHALAADSIYVSTELTRNGVVVDNFAGLTTGGSTLPHHNVELIKYRNGIVKGKVVMAELELGTTASITPVVTSDGSILYRFDVDYIRLEKMIKADVGSTYTEQPKTDGWKHAATDTIPNGGKREYKSFEDGIEYIYTVSATKQ